MSSSGPDFVYYNMLITNPTNSPNSYIQASKVETRTQAIIDKPSDYYLTIARMSCPGFDIPNVIASIQAGATQTDPNLTNWGFVMEYNNVRTPVNYITFIPGERSERVAVPPPPSTNPPNYTQTNSYYYFIYEYDHMIAMMNNGLQSTKNLLAGMTGATAVANIPTPFFTYSPETQFVTLNAPIPFCDIGPYGSTGQSTNLKIYCNSQLFNFVQSMLVYGVGDHLYQFVVNNTYDNFKGNTSFYNPPGGTTAGQSGYYQVSTEVDTLRNWNALSAIVITSGSLPIRAENVPNNNLSQLLTANQSDNATRNVLVDFLPTLERGGDQESTFVYYPFQYRYIDLLGQQPITSIDMQIWWQDVNNVLHPIELSYGQSASIKLLFVRKTVIHSAKIK